MVPLLVASLLFGLDMPANPLLGELLTQGVPLPMGPTFRLPGPVMADGLDAKQQEAVLKKTADDLPFDLFTSTSEAAPHVLKIDSVVAAGKRVAQTVDLYFLAYGKLERVVQDDVLNKLIGTDAKKTKDVVAVKVLSAEALRKRGIELQQGAHLEERYAHLDVFLLDKIKITGITHNLRTDGPGSVVLTMQLDARFANDQEYPNRWRILRCPDREIQRSANVCRPGGLCHGDATGAA